jgi:hypothetical protein
VQLEIMNGDIYATGRRESGRRERHRPFTRDQRTTIVYGMLAFVLMLVVLQLWLLTSTMNAYLGGDESVIWPAAMASLACPAAESRAAALSLSNRSHAPMSRTVETMHPAYFALVMATGIVSIACQLLELRPIAVALLWANWCFFVILWALTMLRGALHQRGAADLCTTAAPSASSPPWRHVRAGQPVMVVPPARDRALAVARGAILWAGDHLHRVRRADGEEPRSRRWPTASMAAGWFPGSAAQSCLCSDLRLPAGSGENAPHVLLFCLAMWLGGGMLYYLDHLADLLSLHLLPISPSDLRAPVLDQHGRGRHLDARRQPCSPVCAAFAARARTLLPFIKGLTLMFWATATWWIPDARDSRRLAARLPAVPAATTTRSTGARSSRWACIRWRRSVSPRRSTRRS